MQVMGTVRKKRTASKEEQHSEGEQLKRDRLVVFMKADRFLCWMNVLELSCPSPWIYARSVSGYPQAVYNAVKRRVAVSLVVMIPLVPECGRWFSYTTIFPCGSHYLQIDVAKADKLDRNMKTPLPFFYLLRFLAKYQLGRLFTRCPVGRIYSESASESSLVRSNT